MPTGLTLITGSNFRNAAGQPLASGRMYCWPVNNDSQSISGKAGTAGGGAILNTAVVFLIVNGAITTDTAGNPAQLYDSMLTNPANLGYRVRIVDTSNNSEALGPGYDCVQPSGASWSFDTFTPPQPALTTITAGPQGLSAYQVWLAEGNTGTVGEFFATLQGEVSALSFASFMAAALANPSRNWINYADIVPNTYLDYPSGISGPLNGWTSYRKIPANAGGQMVINQPVSATYPNGIAFYTVGEEYISGIPGFNQEPFQLVNVPPNAAYIAFGVIGGPYGPPAVYWGNSLPAASSTEFAVTSDITSAITALQVQTATSYTPKNIFNAANVHAVSYISCNDGTLGVAGGQFQTFGASDFCSILPGQKFVLSAVQSAVGGVGLAFYLNGVFISGIQSANQAPGTVFTAPPGCNQMRTTLQTSQAPTFMVWTDSVLPASYVPYGSSLGAVALAAAQSAAYPGLVGKKFAVHGDSITVILGDYWQNEVIAKAGVSLVYQNGQAGRVTGQAFSDYSGTGGTYTSQPGQTSNLGCTVGNTFARDIQAANPNFAIIELATNDGATPIGTPGDPSTAATLCGAVALVLGAYQAAVPACRLMWVVPYQYNYNGFGASPAHLQAMVTAIQQTCALSGVPVANMFAESGIGAATWSLYLEDGVHINPTGADACFVPLILATLGKMFR